ncbi:MAG: hypothetical protein ACRDRL_04260, partial [Sciscionella sp.]
MPQASQPDNDVPDSDTLIKQIGVALMRSAPESWQQINAEFRASGRYYELSAEITEESGVTQPWTATHDIAMRLAQLRGVMHAEPGGTWFNARYSIERPSKYNLEFDRSEPRWQTPPPLQVYRDELHYFPRAEDDVPEWLIRKLSGLAPEHPQQPPAAAPPQQPSTALRVARIFDGVGASGRPSVNRPPVVDTELDEVIDYLTDAPRILPERGLDIDRLSGDGRQRVPVAFHSDGSWIWPAAVPYYLRHYGLPPEQGLLENIRQCDYLVPEVDAKTCADAAAQITGGRPAPMQQPTA